MPSITEYCGIPVEWKIPPLKVGDEITFWYWNNEFSSYRGHRGKIIGIRYLSAKPIDIKTKQKRSIVRGNVIYTIAHDARRSYISLRYASYKKMPVIKTYNQRMSNVKIL